MLQPPDVLAVELFVDKKVIDGLECIICNNVCIDPVQCRRGHAFCRSCLLESLKRKKQCPTCRVALAPATMASNLIAKNMIEDAQVYCFTRLPALEAGNTSASSDEATDVDADDDDDVGKAAGKKRARAVPAGSGSSSSSSSSSSNRTTAAKRAKSDYCTWTGKLQDAKQHFNECVYAGALCGFGCGAVVRRIDMPEHEASICPERGMMCANVGCGALIREPMIAAHKANDCLYEEVDCPFSSVGCNERVLRKDVDSHEEAAMKQHNRLLLQDNRSLRQDNLSFRQDIQSVQQDNLSLRQDILSLQQKVAEQEQRLDEQQQQIVFKVKLADLVRGGEVDVESDEKVVGAYSAFMIVQKGYAVNGDCCGVYLHLVDGPFPCHVSFTIEVVHWDGKSENARKIEDTDTYKRAKGRGFPKFIRLSQLTAAASPYVKDGHITFIVTFRFLPME